MMETDRQMYSPAALADRWACSEATILKMIREGELPAWRMGRRSIRIKADDVRAAESRTIQASAS